jgi:peptidoglycan hydrolase CwlO-like protein
MHLRTFALAAPIALGLGLAACDSRDYEAEITALQSDLESARSELQTAQGENEQLKTQMEELQAQAEQAGGAGEQAGGAIEGDLNRIVENANAALTSLTQLETQAPDADISGLRENVNQIMEAAQATAEQAGVQLQEAVQPAAGPEGQQEPGAGGQGGDQPEPAAGPAEQDSEGAQEPARSDQPAQQGGQQQQ